VLVWVIGNATWTLLSAAFGAIVSGVLRGIGVLDNAYALVGIALLVAAAVASIVASKQRQPQRTTQRATGRLTSPPLPRLPRGDGQIAAQASGMTVARREAAIRQYERTRAQEAEALEAKQAQARAEAQLGAAIRSGNCLRARGYEQSALGLQWQTHTEALIKDLMGELEASRLSHRKGVEAWVDFLDDLASRLSASGRDLTPSDAWASYVETTNGFRRDLEVDINEGEAMRAEVFEEAKHDRGSAEARVAAWLRLDQETFDPVPELRELPSSQHPAGMMVGYAGLSQEESVPVWRLDRRLQELGPVLTVILPYVQALKGE
jgi:hypothetical protein